MGRLRRSLQYILMKDWSILLIKNTKGTLLQRLYWWLIRGCTNAGYNHCQLVRDFNGTLYICESTISGFCVTKTLARWQNEQKTLKRVFQVIDIAGASEERFKTLLGNKYDAGYWVYLFKNYSSYKSTNCFQSVAFIFNMDKYWLATANTFIKS
jgi:hypothetical protein